MEVAIIDFDYWMAEAEKSIANKVKIGQKFELRGLFEQVRWEELTKGERIAFGKYFANAVAESLFPNVERIQKANNNHTLYKKTEEK